MPNDLLEVVERDGKRGVVFHPHPGQLEAWRSRRRIVCVLAGAQSGKTSFGPPWVQREIQAQGPGDYLVVTPSFPLLELKCLPEFRKVFEDIYFLGSYVSSPVRKFTLSPFGQKVIFGDHGTKYKTTIYFGYAAEPESLESATARAAWLDEAGQKKFKAASWDAILRRLSLARGRVLITTTPYNLGWLKQQIWDKWRAGAHDIDVIRFESIANPLFSREEWEDAKSRLPKWKFDMFYRALFTRPAGLIYDCFDESWHKVKPFTIPDHWPRYIGLDFGGVNTVALFYAEDPETGILYLYREYYAGGRTAEEHVREMLRGEPEIKLCVGGSKSEGQWRREFKAAGLDVRPPSISSVEVGIDRVYGAHKKNKIRVFEGCTGYLDEKLSYSRVLDEAGNPTEAIEDKETFHHMDGERYIIGRLMGPAQREATSKQG